MIKRIFLCLFTILPLVLFAQQNYTLKGEIGKLSKPAKAYLIYNDGGQQSIDSTDINEGKFLFKGIVHQPSLALLAIDHKGVGIAKMEDPDLVNLFLEAGEISIKGVDSVSKALLSGTPLNNDQQKLTVSLAPIMAKEDSFMDRFRASTEEQRQTKEFKEQMDKEYEEIQKDKQMVQVNFIQSNPKSLISLNSLLEIAGSTPDAFLIEPLLNSLSQEIQNLEPAKVLRSQIDISKKVSIGAVAPDFIQHDPNGKPVSLSSFKGKYVLIDFWASWCGPCRQENPNLVAAYNAFKGKNFTVFGVSLDRETGRNAWLKAIKDDQLIWTQVSDLKFWENEAAILYGVRSIPQNYLIDPTGKIIGKNLRGEELHLKLAEILN